MKHMSLEQVRNALLDHSTSTWPLSMEHALALANSIDAHLAATEAQTVDDSLTAAYMVGYEKGKALVAQTVNVAAIREVIKSLLDPAHYDRDFDLAMKLSTALPKE
jgi:ribosomal protein L18